MATATSRRKCRDATIKWATYSLHSFMQSYHSLLITQEREIQTAGNTEWHYIGQKKSCRTPYHVPSCYIPHSLPNYSHLIIFIKHLAWLKNLKGEQLWLEMNPCGANAYIFNIFLMGKDHFMHKHTQTCTHTQSHACVPSLPLWK